ncbi:mediator of RNA polymerase II transcription subunit 17-like isoform X1 [Zea mays]|uniref:Mediator of RNA polymerase II transcription subunit 17 n=2 Tax=Zea mays TaxID=4577 RepID=C0HIU9_MAIZE|nr:mediator of RNA polymerase II transcription subunit 17-like [Zea mays]XP_008679945.1 mediator of RNA polymerase II transcription subunit 17-like isoform X1 [Zea mays]ACN26952.1 unknown [Zea mays]AQK60591.1 Mediator of RNA polymerase II transcription subunit 17 [Zea mays]AQK60592.1 Mediator of RNA polymerase II transcription subunit 17 [Zea mays]AQK60593.1 Mediator of RNA polymerase II transcription subunit 17 [Zea mays]|eukprot:NP_001288373.1 mediator of RNA polymerase II transcription subunit 17-like [Zea mays]
MEKGDVLVDLDKLPMKRLEAIDETGNEHYPPDTSNEEQRLAAIRRIDFSWVIEKDAKKAKKAAEADTTQQAWPWQGLMESLQQAHQELSVVIDLIGTVEANDAMAVASTTKPKSQPNEILVDMAVCAATKLQCLRHLSRYFKQSATTMEQQFQKETRFYSSLIRLQQNWKVKRQRSVGSPGSEGFMFDLVDTSQLDTTTMPRLSPLSLIPIDQDSSGTLSVQIPQKCFHSLSLRFHGDIANNAESSAVKRKEGTLTNTTTGAENDVLENDDVNKSTEHAHSILRDIHKSIFEEQVFDMVIQETFIQSQGINVTGMCEDFLQLAIGQECSLCLSHDLSGQNNNSGTVGQEDHMDIDHTGNLAVATVNGKESSNKDVRGFPNPKSLEIYLLHVFHEGILRKLREKSRHVVRYQSSAQGTPDECGLLSHFCMTVSHRIFSSKVHLELESVVSRVPYLHLCSLPTWHSRTSSWSLCLKVPQPILATDRVRRPSDYSELKCKSRSQFGTKVILKDGQISLMGEGSPSIAGSLAGKPSDGRLVNSYNCDLEDLPMMLLQQVASQVIHWLHDEAVVLGMNATIDFLCLYLDLDQGETLGLVAHVDPDDTYGCVSWYLTLDHHPTEEGKMSAGSPELEERRFLGYLSPELLYSTLMDLVKLCSTGVQR